MLTLQDLQRWRACPRAFWLQRHGQVQQPLPDGGDDLPEGPLDGRALRASYPVAHRVPAPHGPGGWAQAVRATRACMDAAVDPPEGWAVLGACLQSPDGLRVRIDVLTRGTRGWQIARVRHATVGSEADVDAVAFWVHVAARAGLQVQGAALLLIDTDFMYPGHGLYAGLFRAVDLGPRLGSRPVGAWVQAMRAGLRGPVPQACGCEGGEGAALAPRCACGAGRRSAPTRGDPALSLEIVGRELGAALRAEGHADLRSVPPERLADARHRRVLRAVRSGRPVLDRPTPAALGLDDADAPRWHLRMDTVGFAVPIWSGTQPYQSLPYQWTCALQRPGRPVQQRLFIAGPGGDPRRLFAESLLQGLGRAGPVFAYNAGFERNRLRELAERFDDLAVPLQALERRIVDLFQLARSCYYHPAMAGSWSFRAIGAAAVPGLAVHWDATDLASTAAAAFARSLRPDAAPELRQRLRKALAAHGLRQLLALRHLVALFEGDVRHGVADEPLHGGGVATD